MELKETEPSMEKGMVIRLEFRKKQKMILRVQTFGSREVKSLTPCSSKTLLSCFEGLSLAFIFSSTKAQKLNFAFE